MPRTKQDEAIDFEYHLSLGMRTRIRLEDAGNSCLLTVEGHDQQFDFVEGVGYARDGLRVQVRGEWEIGLLLVSLADALGYKLVPKDPPEERPASVGQPVLWKIGGRDGVVRTKVRGS